MRTTLVAFISVAAGLASAAAGQQFTNGNFDTGDLSGWTVVNTANGAGAPGSVTTIDIDGPGPLTDSLAATFTVGQVTFVPNAQEGIEMTQMLNLTSGTAYTLDLDWSAQRDATFNNAEGGVFSFIVDGNIIVTQAAGTINNTMPAFGHLHGTFTASSAGAHAVGVRITRPYQGGPGSGAADVRDYVDNITLGGGGPPACYANCDASTTPPILNVNDFICFQTAFAAGASYANCDASTTPPVLNVNDFICFQTRFAAGCP